MSKTLLSIGHGYSAKALGDILLKMTDWHVIATTRSETKAADLRASGVEAVVWPEADLAPYLARATHVLSSVAPDASGDPVLAAHAQDLINASDHLEWVGYLSTTGVYGDHNGEWVDEDTPLAPTTERGKYRQQAEADWAKLGVALHIFRLAGIYGPTRGPFAKLRAGTARRIVKPNQVFSRIHVDDIAQVLLASIANPNPKRVYNVCDDDPAPPQDIIEYGAQLLGVPVPVEEEFETAQMRPMARSFYAESKRVKNERIKNELGVKLLYPNYKVGLNSLLQNEK